LAQNAAASAASNLFADISKAPAVQSLARRLENGGVLSCPGVCPAAQPFLAVLIQNIFPQRPLVVVAPDLKIQESLQQDIETWLQADSKARSPKPKASDSQLPDPDSQLLFYPAWEVFPHEGKLPHADTISDRLQTLVSLSTLNSQPSTLVVTSVTALLQKTFPPGEIQKRTRKLQRGDKIIPLDLIEWLEEQGYESEAQVTQKGEIALRGGILDVWPLTSPWPVRLEFFGDELESLRHFDPLTQISRGGISSITIPPGGELGILKSKVSELATLLDYLPQKAIFILCEPEQLAARAGDYGSQTPKDDPFFISWPDFLAELIRRDVTSVELVEVAESGDTNPQSAIARFVRWPQAPEPQIAEAQRREFFAQLHRWLRQGHAVHVFLQQRRRAASGSGKSGRITVLGKDASAEPDLSRPAQAQIGSPRFSLCEAQTRGRDGRGDFWALQSPAAAPA
jgi:transcription-repair coupling factor (superfamily II helicase)